MALTLGLTGLCRRLHRLAGRGGATGGSSEVSPRRNRAARDCFALAPSRLMGNLGVRLMWALVWWAPKDQQRGACADRADEPREFLMGRTTAPW